MALTLTLLLATLIASALVLTALLPTRAALWAGCATNAVQLHSIALLGIYPSLALLSWLSLWRSVLHSGLWQWRWMQALVLLAAVQSLSLLWSPAPLVGIRYLIYLLPLPLVAHAMYRLSRLQPEFGQRCLRLLLLGSVLEALLVVTFRLMPFLEEAFLRHAFAQIFVSPNTLESLFEAGRNNVLDPSKAGGLFVNANIASTYLGMSAMAAWFLGRGQDSALLRLIAIADLIGVCFTGSKAGLICALAIPSGMGLLGVIRSRRVNPMYLLAAAVAVAAGALLWLAPVSTVLWQDYQHDALATLGTREQIWRFALQMLQQHPLQGLGFGGWEQRFQLPGPVAGLTLSIPPHNSLFILWLQSGAFGVLAGLAVILALYAAIARAFARNDDELRELALATAGAFSWYLIQGMGENFGLIGEIHMTPFLGVLLGHLCARCDSAADSHEHSNASVRRAPAAPALQGV